MIRWAGAALLGLVLAVGVAGVSFRSRLAAVGGTDGAAEEVFEVERGASLGRVAWQLEDRGLIRDARAFRWWAWLTDRSDQLKAGEYAISPAWSATTILDRLVRGTVMTHEVVIPEGTRASEIAARLQELGLADADEFMAAVGDASFAEQLGVEGDSLEGYLFPETYRLPRGLEARAVARTMVDEFLAEWDEIAPRAEERGLGMREVVTLASIVEKETAVPAERPLIAAVFLNRLRRGMRLETDPTVIYGIEDFDGNLRKRDLLDADNPYNTYRHVGLPPGPIASPGADALRAVVEPAQSDYLYFVSMNDGTHKFSRTYREHADAVDRYQKKRRASR